MARSSFSVVKPLDDSLKESMLTLEIVINGQSTLVNLWDELLGFESRDVEELPDSELIKAMNEAPSKYAFYATMKERVSWELETLETKYGLWMSERIPPARVSLQDRGVKTPTERAILAEIVSTQSRKEAYERLQAEMARLRRDMAIMGVAAKAMDRRMDLLQSIGAIRRSERMSV